MSADALEDDWTFSDVFARDSAEEYKDAHSRCSFASNAVDGCDFGSGGPGVRVDS